MWQGTQGDATERTHWIQLVMNLNVVLRGLSPYIAGVRPSSELDRPAGECCNNLGGRQQSLCMGTCVCIPLRQPCSVLTSVPALFPLPAPCCPSDINPVLVSSDRVEIVWSPVRGAELYETKAVGGVNSVECNDTAPACTLSALACDTRYNITVYSFSEVRGSNTSCASRFITTGTRQQGPPSPMSV